MKIVNFLSKLTKDEMEELKNEFSKQQKEKLKEEQLKREKIIEESQDKIEKILDEIDKESKNIINQEYTFDLKVKVKCKADYYIDYYSADNNSDFSMSVSTIDGKSNGITRIINKNLQDFVEELCEDKFKLCPEFNSSMKSFEKFANKKYKEIEKLKSIINENKISSW